MRIQDLRLAALSAAIIGCIPFGASAQLEEIIVTATRRETDLQSTPLSIQAFTAEQLELGGITNGRDLGIMVPNVVLNPATGGGQAVVLRSRLARRRPLRRRRVAGRLRLPADEFHRVRARRGVARSARHVVRPQYQRRRGQHDDQATRPTSSARASSSTSATSIAATRQIAVDVPITDNLKTKFIGGDRPRTTGSSKGSRRRGISARRTTRFCAPTSSGSRPTPSRCASPTTTSRSAAPIRRSTA